MNKKMILVILVVTMALGLNLPAQDSAENVHTQRLYYIDTHPGKGQAWRELVRESSMKAAQVRANAGEIVSWSLLRSVYPAGEEARANYLISEISAGPPSSFKTGFKEALEASGSEMSHYEVISKRNDLATLVTSELWRPRIYEGAAEKGNYLTINMMKVKNRDILAKNTTKWSPLSQEWIKQGAMTGWVYATKLAPSGAETPYAAYTSDMYPSFEAAFAGRNLEEVFAKVYPGESMDDYLDGLGEGRAIAKRELWRVVERVTKEE